MLRLATIALLVTLVTLQVRLWAGDGSLAEVWRLERDIERQQGENALALARNERMVAQVVDLRNGKDAVEDLARRELGLIHRSESFFLIVEPQK